MKFFNLDCHISVIADIKSILTKLGHTVDSWSLSDHGWVFGRTRDHVKYINQDTWRSLDGNLIRDFTKHYDSILKNYDAFICTYPPAFSMIYEKYDKPIYLHIPIRYEYPFTAYPEKWCEFNEYLHRGYNSGQLKILSNSVYDQKYFENFTLISPILVRNICDYTGIKYQPTDKVLLHGRLSPDIHKLDVTDTKSLGNYSWDVLNQFKAVVFIPYNCSQMSFFEYYSAGIPILCPSLKFLNSLRRLFPDSVMSELSWNKILGIGHGSVVPSLHDNDPNDYLDNKSMDYWSSFSDYYTLPGVIHFDSWEEAATILRNDLPTINTIEYKEGIISQWNGLLRQ